MFYCLPCSPCFSHICFLVVPCYAQLVSMHWPLLLQSLFPNFHMAPPFLDFWPLWHFKKERSNVLLSPSAPYWSILSHYFIFLKFLFHYSFYFIKESLNEKLMTLFIVRKKTNSMNFKLPETISHNSGSLPRSALGCTSVIICVEFFSVHLNI